MTVVIKRLQDDLSRCTHSRQGGIKEQDANVGQFLIKSAR